MEDKFTVQVKGYLKKGNKNVEENTLKILNDENKMFAVDMLLAFQNRDVDKMAERLEKGRESRKLITEWIQVQEIDEQVSACFGGYINTWNLFNKILQIEDERNRTSARMMRAIGKKTVEKRVLLFVYDHPHARCAEITKYTGISKYRVLGIMDTLADHYIVYKVNMGAKTFYDLTESAKRWLDEHIVSWRMGSNPYFENRMIDRYQDQPAATVDVGYKSPQIKALFAKQFDFKMINKNDLIHRVVEVKTYEYGTIQEKHTGVK